jgi:hypothetical protein
VTFTLAVLQQARNSSRLVQAGKHALHNPLSNTGLEFVYGQMAASEVLDPSTAPASYQAGIPGSITNLPSNQDVYPLLPLAQPPT